MSDLLALIDQGILYEDQFIQVYLSLLRDEGFMEFFGSSQEEARALLDTMILESGAHRSSLEKVKQALG